MVLRAGWLLAIALFVIAGCGDDSRASTAPDAGAVVDGATPDAMPSDATATADTGQVRPPSEDHNSFIPAGLTPEAATRLLVMGDSISAGSGASRSNLVYHSLLVDNDDAAWPGEADSDLRALTGGIVDVVDVSVGGSVTASLGGQTRRALEQLSLPSAGHTVVVITIGGNDLQGAIFGGNPTGQLLDDAIAAIRAVVETLSVPANFPDGISLYLANVYDPSDGQGQIQGCFLDLELPALVAALDVWSDRYKALAAELGFAVIDMLGHFHGHGHNFDNTANPFYDAADPTIWFADCLHPDDRGHHELRRLFFQAMSPSYAVE